MKMIIMTAMKAMTAMLAIKAMTAMQAIPDITAMTAMQAMPDITAMIILMDLKMVKNQIHTDVDMFILCIDIIMYLF